jgi:hypothetical protein
MAMKTMTLKPATTAAALLPDVTNRGRMAQYDDLLLHQEGRERVHTVRLVDLLEPDQGNPRRECIYFSRSKPC